jgi:hypothetical protein
MEVTARHVEEIPRGNLRVPRGEFVALWRVTEHLMVANRGDWYVAGVAMTCRWLACAAVPSVLGGWELAWAPVTQRAALAHEEVIAAAKLSLTEQPAPPSTRPSTACASALGDSVTASG